jgi:hypothetical protein
MNEEMKNMSERPTREFEERLDATVDYVNSANKLMHWCERLPPLIDTLAYADWAGERDAILCEVADKRRTLAEICRSEDAGMHGPIWARLAEGCFEEVLTCPYASPSKTGD